VDLILDHLGAAYLAPNMKALAIGGKLVLIGVMSGIKAEINLGLLLVKRQQIIGSVIRARSVKEKAEITAAFTKTVMPKLADRTIVPIVYRTLALDDVAEAHRLMEESRHFGKIVLTVH
jgi:NADPH:quinone reductase-like Zn-dependent oxidoreductase